MWTETIFPLSGRKKALTLQIPEITGRGYHYRKSQAKLDCFCDLYHIAVK